MNVLLFCKVNAPGTMNQLNFVSNRYPQETTYEIVNLLIDGWKVVSLQETTYDIINILSGGGKWLVHRKLRMR